MSPSSNRLGAGLLVLIITVLLVTAGAAEPGAEADRQIERGLALMEIGDYERAEAIFRELIRQDPLGPEAYNNLAVVLVKRGRYDEAQATLDRALQSNPAYGPIFRNLRIVGAHRAGQAYSRAFASAPPSEPDLEVITQVIAESRTLLAASRPASATLTLPESGSAAVSGGSAGSVQRDVGSVPAVSPIANSIATPSQTASSGPVVNEDPMVALLDSVERWRRAWSSQDVTNYIAVYARSYQPRGMDRLAWEAQRQQRLTAPASIDVTISRIAVDMNGGQASVNFRQRYRSDAYEDEVDKTLTLRLEEGEWRIIAENSAALD
jgi:tetratricopeptide (TPR) repeat protein